MSDADNLQDLKNAQGETPVPIIDGRGRNQWAAADASTDDDAQVAVLNAMNLSAVLNHQTVGFNRASHASDTALIMVNRGQIIDSQTRTGNPYGSSAAFYFRRGRFTPQGSTYWKEVWSIIDQIPSVQSFSLAKLSRTEIACTPDVPIDFPVPPSCQIWKIADKEFDLDLMTNGPLVTRPRNRVLEEYAFDIIVSTEFTRTTIEQLVAATRIFPDTNPAKPSPVTLLKAMKNVATY